MAVRRSTIRRGTNSIQLRRYNERLILRTLRHAGEASKAELAWQAEATNTVVGSIIPQLEDDGLVDAPIGGLRAKLAATVPEAGQPPQALHGIFGCDAGAIGAAALPMFFSFSPRASILTRSADERGWRDHAAAD